MRLTAGDQEQRKPRWRQNNSSSGDPEPKFDHMCVCALMWIATYPAGLPSLQVTDVFTRKFSFMSWSSFCAEHGYRDCARFFTCVMKLSMFSSTAVKSRGKLSVVSPLSARCVGGGGERRGCGLRPPRNLRAHRAPDCITTSRNGTRSSDGTILAAFISDVSTNTTRTERCAQLSWVNRRLSRTDSTALIKLLRCQI